MIEIVELSLKGTVPDEVYDHIERAFDLFDRLNLNDYILPFEEISAVADNHEPGYVQEAMISLIAAYVDGILHEHSIFMMPGTPLSVTVEIMEGILSIPDYEGVETILDLIEDGSDPAETLAEILTLVTRFEVEDILPHFQSVNTALISKIRSVLTEQLAQPEPNEEQEQEKTARSFVMSLWEWLEQPENPFMTSVFAGIPLCLQYNIYASQHLDYYQSASPDDITKMMMLMSAASEEGAKVFIRPIAENIELYIADPDRLKAIDKLLHEYFIGYTRYVEKRTVS